MTLRTKAQGFTIVELLIVIVVIGILAAITIVAYNGVTEKARVSAGKSFAGQVKHRDLADAVGTWTFDECSGTTLANTGGNAATPSNNVTGTTTFSTETPNGTGCSLSLNGSSYITTVIGLSNTYYSKSLWFKTASGSSAMNLISDAGTGNQSAFYINTLRISSGHNNVWSSVAGTTALNDDKWHFAYLEYKANTPSTTGTMTVSIDGVIVDSKNNVNAMTSPTNPVAIGTFNGGSNFSGLIDDVMIVVK